MGKILTAAFLLLTGIAATDAAAQQAGKTAGGIMLRSRLIGVLPAAGRGFFAPARG